MIPMRPETDVGAYGRVLERWRSTSLVDHFPVEIPTSAVDVRMSSFPGFLQGGAWFQLRMRMPEADVRKLRDEFERKAVHRFDGGMKMDHINGVNIATTTFLTNDTDEIRFR
jgi:hypothetical protein